jgi:hypothetical protein
MSVKKAKGKGKATTKKSGKRSTPTDTPEKKGKDLVQVRENINELVKASAQEIAIEVIKVALTGQLATAKYLFEAVGLYPATEQAVARPIETTLAHTLLRRMGLPLDPVICDEDLAPTVLTSNAKGASTELLSVAKEDRGGEGDEEQKPAQSEQAAERGREGEEDTVE